MIFHSLDFVVFLLAFLAVYWRLGRRGQNVLIVAGSYVFYGYVHPWFVILIAATTIVDYAAALAITRRPRRRRLWLGLSLGANLGLLGTFKYFNFFATNVQGLLAMAGLDVSMPTLAVVLPVGISFYTFQEISYTVGVYRGSIAARTSLVDFAAYVCFFPQLVAGPIERAEHLLPQVEHPRRWVWSHSRDALFLVCWGYVKKLAVADNVGLIANKVFSLDAPGFTVLWAGVFAFAIQIYADFSAYSDIARGVARLLGFDLMENFRQPYMATGPADFWRRWHISLSTWFRDFVYIPLGGSQVARAARVRNLFVTFLLSGFWHGASWNYVIWGGYHGALVAAERWLGHPEAERRRLLWDLPHIVFTFGLVCLGWLLFRETDLTRLVHDLSLVPWNTTLADRRVGAYLFLLAAAYSLPVWVEGLWVVYWRRPAATREPPSEIGDWRTVGQTVLAGLAFAAILVLRSQQSLDFIYFQF